MAKQKVKIPNASELNNKIEADANDFKAKYPKIAKMTVAEVVATDTFSDKFKKVMQNYKDTILRRPASFYHAFKSLESTGLLNVEDFKKEYVACMDELSNLPVIKRVIVLQIGDKAYNDTVNQMIKDYEKA